MSNRSAQELAEGILSLYDVRKSQDNVIADLYLPNATFTDPLLTVKGVENIQAQFRSLPSFIKSSSANLIRGSMAGGSVLTVDSMMIYRLKPFPSFMKVTLRVFMVIEISQGKISSHTDHWDFVSVVSNLPVVSFFYSHFRPIFGATSSAIIKTMIPVAPRHSIAHQKAESSQVEKTQQAQVAVQ